MLLRFASLLPIWGERWGGDDCSKGTGPSLELMKRPWNPRKWWRYNTVDVLNTTELCTLQLRCNVMHILPHSNIFTDCLASFGKWKHIQQENTQNPGTLSWLLFPELTFWKTSSKTPNCSVYPSRKCYPYLIEGLGVGRRCSKQEKCPMWYRDQTPACTQARMGNSKLHTYFWQRISVSVGVLSFFSTCYVGTQITP